MNETTEQQQQQLLRIPTGRGQTSWLFTSAAEILLLPREREIHFFELTCNFLFVIWTLNAHGKDWKAGFDTSTGYYYKQNKAGIVTSLLNMTTRVTHEKYATWFPDVVVVLILRVF